MVKIEFICSNCGHHEFVIEKDINGNIVFECAACDGEEIISLPYVSVE